MNITIERLFQYLGKECAKCSLLEDEIALMRVQFAQLQEALRASSEDKPGGRRENKGGKAEGDREGKAKPEGDS